MEKPTISASAAPPAVYAAVAVSVPVRREFTYAVGPDIAESLVVGARVRVPFGGRVLDGTVVGCPAAAPDPAVEVRPIQALLNDTPVLPSSVLELTRFVADYYLCSWGEAIEAATPPVPPRRRPPRWVRRLPLADASKLPAGATARRRLLALLPADGTAVPLERIPVADRRAVRSMCENGWLELFDRTKRPARDSTVAAGTAGERAPTPTRAQSAILDELAPALSSRRYAPFLLYGATGSGKTEVYFRAAERVLDQGRSVLYLVPEIGLTPLLQSKISRRFPGRTVVLHSALSARERREGWERARDGNDVLVVGTRSAVFAPLSDPGLIVVDEEQDSSYKQGESPRYNGRDLALVRGRSAEAVVLLGSATPSMESFQHALSGRYRMLRLGGRIEDRPLPEVCLVDMREAFRQSGSVTPLSPRLVEELRACLSRGEQALILRNRRGWAVALLCPRCGERICCARCSISLTWHRTQRRLRCHYCNSEQPYPDACPTCGAEELHELGEGTERVEQELRDALPAARIERMDRDTTQRKGAREELLRRFERGEIDVLLGTQMIAKGHDFPRVTLVGVLSADQSLGLPDFRSGERTFQLLTQVAGRAGRGSRAGRVIVQAFDPEHPVLALAATQDYEAFFQREIRYRRALRYPPLSALVNLVIHDPDESRARDWGEQLARALRAETEGRLLVSGPGPAPIERLKGRYRTQILVRSAGRRRLVRAVENALAAVEGVVPRRGILVDVDAISLL